MKSTISHFYLQRWEITYNNYLNFSNQILNFSFLPSTLGNPPNSIHGIKELDKFDSHIRHNYDKRYDEIVVPMVNFSTVVFYLTIQF